MLLNRRNLLSLGALAALHQLSGAKPHHAPKAKRAIQISLVGGLSHIDSFDYKPELVKRHGQALGAGPKPDVFFGQVGLLRKPDWEFKKRGQSGLWVSELFPHVAGVADELTVIRSMVADSANHTPALFVQNSGFQFNGYPALGSWLSYGLGSEADDLPAFVVLPDGRGDPNGAASNWNSGFLPAQHQGVIFRGGDAPVRDLFPEKPVPAKEEADSRAALNALNALHLAQRGGEADLAARMNSYALAAKMQFAVPGFTPAPASQHEKPYLLWSRPVPTTFPALCANGVRPNSVVNSTSVSFSIPRSFRSRTSAATGWSMRAASAVWFSFTFSCASQLVRGAPAIGPPL